MGGHAFLAFPWVSGVSFPYLVLLQFGENILNLKVRVTW